MIRQPRNMAAIDAVAAPDDPAAENAATAAVKKPPVNRDAQFDPNAPQLPQAEPSAVGAAPIANPDPNAYQPPPQQVAPPNEVNLTPPASAAQPGPITPPPAMPAAGPISTLSGDWQAPTAAAGSAPLIASAAGGTMTPQGDASNPMRGYTTAEGGSFGGAFADKQNPQAWGAVANGDPQATQAAMEGADPALRKVAAESIARMLNINDTEGAGAQILATLSPEARSAVQEVFLSSTGGYGTDQAGYDPNRAKYAGAYKTSWDRINTNLPSGGGLPKGRLEGNYTPKDPAEQAAGLAAQGLPPVAPSGGPNIPPPPGPDTGMPQPPGPSAVPESAVPVGAPLMVNNAPGSNSDVNVPRGTLPSAQPSASGMGNVAQTAVTPENALTNSMLARAPGADRFKIAQDQYKAAEEASAPQYEADLRQAMRKAAAGGALGSGMLQTGIGDIAQNRDIANRTNRTNLLSEALKGTIGDQFQDVGIAQQQQGFQKGQQEQAFGNEVTQASLQEALKSGDFNRALQMLTAGSTNNPSDTALALSQIFGGQSSAAGASLAQLLSGMGQKKATGTPPSSGGLPPGMLDWLRNQMGGGNAAAPYGSDENYGSAP